MNQDQVMSLVRAVLMFIGNMLVADGVLTSANAPVVETALLTIVGALATAAPIIWGIIVHTKSNMIKSVNAADNGVKVVPKDTPGPTVNEALK